MTRLLFTLTLTLAAVSSAGAQRGVREEGRAVRPVPNLDRIGVDERLDQQMPRDAAFRDHEGRPVTLGDYLDGERPVLLTFAYHSCPSLCSLVLEATRNVAKEQQWTPGREYQMVTISIDPRDTPEKAAEKRRESLAQLGREGADWHFLVGDEEAIRRVTVAAGYRYFYDEVEDQYAHAAVAMFLTPSGKLARYIYGLRFDPSDVRLALLEASQGRSISAGERILLYCYTYDQERQGYVLFASNVMKLGGLATMLFLGTFLFILWRREKRRGGLFDEAAPRTPPRSPDSRVADSVPAPPKQVEA
ncbi:MAG: SCO family protein [Myxococcales bacterium]|nr:SCO family protein [Myxococcales bacterium]